MFKHRYQIAKNSIDKESKEKQGLEQIGKVKIFKNISILKINFKIRNVKKIHNLNLCQ
jgi:hypothetical protein